MRFTRPHKTQETKIKLLACSARKNTRSSSNFQAMPTSVLILSCTANGRTCLASCTFCYRTVGQFITEQQFMQLSLSCRHFLERNTDLNEQQLDTRKLCGRPSMLLPWLDWVSHAHLIANRVCLEKTQRDAPRRVCCRFFARIRCAFRFCALPEQESAKSDPLLKSSLTSHQTQAQYFFICDG